MQNPENDKIRQTVRNTYGHIAKSTQVGCTCSPSTCCGERSTNTDASQNSIGIGYSSDDMASVPQGTDMGLGCGNPQQIALLQAGETVLDLGSGPGFDCLLAAQAVGPTGRVIGIDMTTEMITTARNNAVKNGTENVEFRLGEIEDLPVADDSVDAIISNCVINLSPEKPSVFTEAFRVLRPGGRLAITDIVAVQPLPQKIKKDMELYAGCVAGAATIGHLTSALSGAGFVDIHIEPIPGSREAIAQWMPQNDIADYIVSATIQAVKPIG
jgi:arsenite methyltransferase